MLLRFTPALILLDCLVQVGDELLSVNGQPVVSHQQGISLLREARGELKLRVLAPPTLLEVDLFKPAHNSKLGITLMRGADAQTAVVNSLSAEGIAAQSGSSAHLRPGAELRSVNGERVLGHEAGARLLRAARGEVHLWIKTCPTAREVILLKTEENSKLGITLTSMDGASATIEPIPLVTAPEPVLRPESALDLVKPEAVPKELELLQLINGDARPRVPCTHCSGNGCVREAEEAFCCPITLDIMEDPVRLVGTGVTYERSAITAWLATSSRAPMSNEELSSDGRGLLPDLELRTKINAFRGGNPRSSFQSRSQSSSWSRVDGAREGEFGPVWMRESRPGSGRFDVLEERMRDVLEQAWTQGPGAVVHLTTGGEEVLIDLAAMKQTSVSSGVEWQILRKVEGEQLLEVVVPPSLPPDRTTSIRAAVQPNGDIVSLEVAVPPSLQPGATFHVRYLPPSDAPRASDLVQAMGSHASGGGSAAALDPRIIIMSRGLSFGGEEDGQTGEAKPKEKAVTILKPAQATKLGITLSGGGDGPTLITELQQYGVGALSGLLEVSDELAAQYSLLATRYSLFTAHYSLLTTHYLTIKYSLFTTHCLLLTIYYSLLITHCSQLAAHYSLLTTHCSPLSTIYSLLIS